jgi:VWFA-related protein
MKGLARLRSIALLSLGLAVSAYAGDKTLQRPPEFGTSSERVQVDLVVRDKKGEILRGLGAPDVEVFEDGVRQDVASLEFVDRSAAPLTSALADAAPAPPPTFVAVAFDRLSPGARGSAQQAVLRYIDEPLSSKPLIGLYSIDRGLTTLEALTADRDVLRRSLGGLASVGATAFSGLRERDTIRNAYAGMAEGIGQAHVASAELAGVPECRAAEDEVVRRLEVMDARLLEAFGALERDQQGFATTHALLALISGLSTLPGRKAILLFSEGLAIPAGVEASFRSVVAAANRSNVSLYAADAAGLRATSTSDETRRTIDTLQARLRPDGMGGPVRGPSASEQKPSGLQLLEQNEDALRYAPENGLGRLADETGGFLIQGSNDFSASLARIDEELGAYYLLSYAPRDQRYDGRFRTITVKLKRPHGRLQARKGYLAVRTPLPVPVLDNEAPALARLEGGRLPTDVPLRLGGLQFPEAPPLSLVPVVVEVPAHALTAVKDDKAHTFRQDFTIVVLVRDASQSVVAKMSQRYPLTGPLSELDAARSRQVLFYRETRLPPGSYTLEAVAYDAEAGAAGAARATLDVQPASTDRLRASSLMVVRSAEKLEAKQTTAPRPLVYQDVLLYPNLGQPVRREPDQALAFFVTAWPAAGRPDVDARVEVVREGRTVATTPAVRYQAQADGRIQLASSFPLASLPPGTYELRVTLSDGQDAETRTAAVPITP